MDDHSERVTAAGQGHRPSWRLSSAEAHLLSQAVHSERGYYEVKAAVEQILAERAADHPPVPVPVPVLPRREGLRDDVTHDAVLALRLAADNLPVGRPGESQHPSAQWLRRRADAFEDALAAEPPQPPAP